MDDQCCITKKTILQHLLYITWRWARPVQMSRLFQICFYPWKLCRFFTFNKKKVTYGLRRTRMYVLQIVRLNCNLSWRQKTCHLICHDTLLLNSCFIWHQRIIVRTNVMSWFWYITSCLVHHRSEMMTYCSNWYKGNIVAVGWKDGSSPWVSDLSSSDIISSMVHI